MWGRITKGAIEALIKAYSGVRDALNVSSGKLYVDTSGSKVGINTTTPEATLDIRDPGSAVTVQMTQSGASGVDKVGTFYGLARDSANPKSFCFGMSNISGANRVIFGGGSSSYAAVNSMLFFTQSALSLGSGSIALSINKKQCVGINTSNFDETAQGCFSIKNGTAPAAGTADQVYLYSKDVASSSELFTMDEAGNETQLSNHDPATGKYYYNSTNTNTGRTLIIQMEDLLKDVADHMQKKTGKVYYTENKPLTVEEDKKKGRGENKPQSQ